MIPSPTRELVQRLAWMDAYLAHYGAEPAEIFTALRVDALVFETLREHLRQTLDGNRARGDLELESRYSHEMMRARATLTARKITLDDLVLALSVRRPDDLALPDLVLSGDFA